jgi:hypothetical protein
MEFQERLKSLKMTTLKNMRLRSDLIQKFKFEHMIDKIKWHSIPQKAALLSVVGSASSIRGNKFRTMAENKKRVFIQVQFF